MAKKLKIYNGSSWEDVTFAITPPATNVTNTFDTNQVIDTSTSVAALRVTQRGTGEAFRVEDSTNPDASPFVINADGLVGIGTADFSVRASTNLGARIVTNGGMAIINYGDDSSITIGRANGTSSSPTQVLANQRIAFFIGSSYGSSSFNNNTAINFHAAENQTDTARGSFITFDTTAVGTVGRAERMRIASDGLVTFDGTGLISRISGVNKFEVSSGAVKIWAGRNGALEGGEMYLASSGGANTYSNTSDAVFDWYDGIVRLSPDGFNKIYMLRPANDSGTAIGLRNVTASTSNPSGGQDGDMWAVYV